MPIMINIGNIQYVIVAMAGGLMALGGFATGITPGRHRRLPPALQELPATPSARSSQQLNSVIMGLAGAERIFQLMDEAPEEDHGVVTLVNVSYDKSGSQLEESEKPDQPLGLEGAPRRGRHHGAGAHPGGRKPRRS